jgi:glycosyltransferase involved in cell wall biosynthesis
MQIAIWWQQESWGGVDTHLAALFDAWPLPDDVFTLFYNAENPGVKRIESAIAARGIRCVAVPEWQSGHANAARRVVAYLLAPLRFLMWRRRAARQLALHGPFDALISDNGGYPGAWTCLAALWASKKVGIPKRMLLVHHSAITYGLGRRFFEQMIDRGVQVWATDLVAVSRATRESLIRLRFFNTEQNPIRVIHNGVRLSVIGPRDPALREGWGAGPHDFIIGMMGLIERYKGHEDVLLAMAELPPDVRERSRLVVVGTGSAQEYERLRSIAEKLGLVERIHFAGYVAGDPAFIARHFDLLAMVTKDFEGFGLTVAEAMVAGTPVLATNVGGVSEYATPEVALLVPPESPTDIARGIEAVFRDPASAQARAQRAQIHIASFSDKIMSRKFRRLLSL